MKKKPTIVCVDDEPMILDGLKMQLKKAFKEEYLIETAEGGRDALELIQELKQDNYETVLIISDYIMPDLKGDELLKEIHIILPDALKIMLTGQADIEAVTNVINYAKLYRYISKPWQADDLILTVKEAVHSYFQEKKLAEQNAQLQKMNGELESLTNQQANLIVELNENKQNLEHLNSELSRLNEAFLRFVPRQFLQFLEKSSIVDVQLGDQVQQEMSVLFSDIRGFTSLSESMTPAENFKFINAYLSRMEPAIVENNGFIDKYIGDAIMALFGKRADDTDQKSADDADQKSADDAVQTSADDAVQAGIAMLHALTEYNLSRIKPDRPPIKIGIGINTGSLMLGTVGGQSQMAGTVISDAVNLASRLEGLTKNYGVSLLISHETFFKLQDPSIYKIRLVDRLRVKGKSSMVSVFEVFDADPPELKAGKLANQAVFEQALVFYSLKSFTEAIERFEFCLQQTPDDRVAQIYWEHCQYQLKLVC
jgi:class 3 adenylate cyclase/DNA-binding NarL/FixJ family response regulator